MASQPPPSYYGSIPAIATAYQNDPRNKLSQSLLQQATAGNPVAQGGWGVPDGLAKVAQAVAASLAQNKQDKKYAAREHDYAQALRTSLDPQPQPAVQPAPTAAAPDVPNAVAPDVPNAVASALAAPSASPGPGAAPPPPGMAPPPMPGNAPPSAAMAPPAVAPPALPGPGAGGLPTGAMPPVPGAPSIGGMGHPPGMGMIPGGDMSGGPAHASVQDFAQPGGVPSQGFTGGQQGGRSNLAQRPSYTGEQIEQSVLSAIPGTSVGSRQRTREQQAALYAKYQRYLAGGPFAPVAAPPGHSAHEKDLARDFNPPPGMPLRQFASAVQKILPGAVVLTRGEGGHAHVASAPGAAPATRPAPGGAVIPVARQEAVPDALQMPVQRPDAPPVPEAVRSQRMEIARRMLASDNPDMVALAQTYFDKGLTENHDADVVQNGQQYERGNLGYTSDLNDFNAARGDVRRQRVDERSNAQNRNFTSGERVAGEQFTAGQNATQRGLDWRTTQYTQQQENARAAAAQAGDLRRTQLVIEGKHEDAATKQHNQRNAFLSTPTGLKMQTQLNDEINANDVAISKYQQFADLNSRNSTGGSWGGSQFIRNQQGHINPDVGTMNSIANDTTLANLGGSLGTAISDGDRNFIAQANISTTNTREQNTNIINARINALRRKNDYHTQFMFAQADGSYPQFQHDWDAYRNQVSVNPPKGAQPLTFEEWKAYRDAHARPRK